MNNKIRFKNINFFNYNFNYIIKKILRGGYLVAPAASSLTTIQKNKDYNKSLVYSDVAILDSGFFCILLRIFKKINVKKFSGYLFLYNFFRTNFIKNKKILLIDPSLKEKIDNINYLRINGFYYVESYIAPKYSLSNFRDKNILQKISKTKPQIIIINIGGGIQEPLAYYLKQNTKYKKLTIICTGAAIGFFTKNQAPINLFFDKFYLGWLIRTWWRPKYFFPRIIDSIKLIKLFD